MIIIGSHPFPFCGLHLPPRTLASDLFPTAFGQHLLPGWRTTKRQLSQNSDTRIHPDLHVLTYSLASPPLLAFFIFLMYFFLLQPEMRWT